MNVKVKNELTFEKEAMEGVGGWGGVLLQGLPGLLNIPAILCIWKWVSLLKWRSGKGRDVRFSCGGGLCGGMGSFV